MIPYDIGAVERELGVRFLKKMAAANRIDISRTLAPIFSRVSAKKFIDTLDFQIFDRRFPFVNDKRTEVYLDSAFTLKDSAAFLQIPEVLSGAGRLSDKAYEQTLKGFLSAHWKDLQRVMVTAHATELEDKRPQEEWIKASGLTKSACFDAQVSRRNVHVETVTSEARYDTTHDLMA